MPLQQHLWPQDWNRDRRLHRQHRQQDPNKDRCGGGYLGNFRGGFEAITSWGCNHESDRDVNLTFATSWFCSGYDISAAIAVSTGGRVAGYYTREASRVVQPPNPSWPLLTCGSAEIRRSSGLWSGGIVLWEFLGVFP